MCLDHKIIPSSLNCKQRKCPKDCVLGQMTTCPIQSVMYQKKILMQGKKFKVKF